MLVRNNHLGDALASCFSSATDPTHNVVLMSAHGFTVVGDSIEESVLRAIYTRENALIQTAALTTHAAHYGPAGRGPALRYLDWREADASAEMTQWSAMRPWGLWLREVEVAGLYINHVGGGGWRE